MDDDAAELFVGHLKRHTLAVLDLKIVGRIIQPERFVRCDLFCIVAAILQSHEHTAIFVRRNGIHQGIVHLADLKGRIGDALTVVILVDLDDLHATNRRVVEVESLCIVGVDNHGLGTSVFVNGITGDRFHLRRYYGAGDAGNGDFTRLIRPVQAGGGQRAALGIYIGTVGIDNLELYALQRFFCNGVLLHDDEIALWLIAELHRDNFIGLDLDRLRRIVENVAVLRAGFLDDKCGAGGDVGNRERTCTVRHELAVGVSDEIAVGIRDKELNIGDGRICYSIHLFHEHAALGLIAELQRHHGIALDLNALRGIVQNVAVFCPHLTGDDSHAGRQAVNADGARAIGHILSVGVADHTSVRVGHKELHIGNGSAGHGVLFDDEEGTHLIIAEGHGDHVLILAGEINGFRGVGDHIPIRRGNLLADISACLETGHDDGSIARSAVLADNCPTRTGGAAKVADSKPCTFQRLTALAIHLADDDCGKRHVLKGQDFALTTGDEAFLRGSLLDGVAVRCFQLRYLIPAILDLRKNDFSACVRKVSAKVVELTGVGMVAAIPDLELSALDGIAGDAVYLADLQRRLESVEEGDGRGFTGFQRHFLRDGAENDMVWNIDLRYFECANRNRVEENPPMVIGGGAGRKAAVDLLDAVGHALDRLTIGDVLLDNFKAGLFIVNESDLGGFAGAQRHGLLGIGYDVRLGNGFLTHNIDTGRNGRERCGAVRPGRDGGRIAAGNGLNGKHRAGNRFAAHGVPLGDLHIGQCVIFGSDRVLLVAIGGIDIDADGRRVGAEALRSLGFHEGPQALGDILDLNDSAILGHIAADDLTVAVNIKFCAIQTTGRSCGNLPQRNISVPSWRLSRLRCIGDEFSRRIIVKESLTPLNTGFRVDCPFCSFILYHSGDDALFCVFFNLALKFCVFLGLFFQHPIDIAQVRFIGIGVGVTTAIDVTIALTLEGLVIPHIRLRSHKKAAGDVTLIVHDE